MERNSVDSTVPRTSIVRMSETNTDRTGVEETPMKRITADEEYTLEVNGFRCPDEFVTFFTPLEFEEVVLKFK